RRKGWDESQAKIRAVAESEQLMRPAVLFKGQEPSDPRSAREVRVGRGVLLLEVGLLLGCRFSGLVSDPRAQSVESAVQQSFRERTRDDSGGEDHGRGNDSELPMEARACSGAASDVLPCRRVIDLRGE